MPEWTVSQENAINARDLSLLVSAGAGSGKTTVLTQRIIERIKRGDSVMDFLVVTFTNSSAADLKEKLYGAISDLAAQHPQEKRYRTQLYLLPGASISTIDSFCLGLVRANFQTLGLSPNVRTADEQEARMLAMDAMEEVAAAFYEEAGNTERAADFSLLADTFAGAKNDEKLLEAMRSVYEKIRAFDDPFGWLWEKGNCLLADAEQLNTHGDLFRTSIGEHLRALLGESLEALAEEADGLYVYIAAAEGAPENLDTAKFWQAQTRLFADTVKQDYPVFVGAAQAYRAVRQPNIKYGDLSEEDQTLYDKGRGQIKKQLDRLLDRFVASPAEIARQFVQTGRILFAMHAFLVAFDRRYGELKREKGVMDFSDAPHFLLRLLEQNGQPTPLCLSLRRQIKEIYIDEYQDVSP
ncbi:MAG: UvrD-helicase domain-containing protein, partial [Oscillospiraceae bacterium]|nr:UvrD-helicase domain-containing protein [Oscillospiraceae bacterium]